MSGIYIHIPFCKKACTYCNFHFSTTFSKYRTKLIKALIKEIEIRKDYLDNKNITSIYFGGGTPSILNEIELQSIIETIGTYYHFDKTKIEITLEANPDDLDYEKLKILKKVGINRLSIGIQSFDDSDLQILNRSHNSNQALNCISISKDIGIKNISIDLMFSLPNSNSIKWQNNLEQALKLEVPHLSIYNLTVEPKTALFNHIKTNKITTPSDTESSKQFYQAKDFLEEQGYVHYEISNYCKSGKEAIHNSKYWTSNQYIGIGPGAHSFNGFSRQWNISNNTKYIKQLLETKYSSEIEMLSDIDKYNEYIITRIRTKQGLNLNEVETNHKKFASYLKLNIENHINKSNLRSIGSNIILTRKAIIISDSIASDLLYHE